MVVGDRADDPVDHDRTTRKHAGQFWKDTAAMPGLIAVGLGAAATCIALFAFAAGHHVASVGAGAVTLLLFGGGIGWLGRESRRVRRVEAQFLREHPEADAQPPAS